MCRLHFDRSSGFGVHPSPRQGHVLIDHRTRAVLSMWIDVTKTRSCQQQIYLFVWVVSGYLQYLSTRVLCRNSTKENEHLKVFISISTFWRPKVHRPRDFSRPPIDTNKQSWPDMTPTHQESQGMPCRLYMLKCLNSHDIKTLIKKAIPKENVEISWFWNNTIANMRKKIFVLKNIRVSAEK